MCSEPSACNSFQWLSKESYNRLSESTMVLLAPAASNLNDTAVQRHCAGQERRDDEYEYIADALCCEWSVGNAQARNKTRRFAPSSAVSAASKGRHKRVP
jgi:hypothetical protein